MACARIDIVRIISSPRPIAFKNFNHLLYTPSISLHRSSNRKTKRGPRTAPPTLVRKMRIRAISSWRQSILHSKAVHEQLIRVGQPRSHPITIKRFAMYGSSKKCKTCTSVIIVCSLHSPASMRSGFRRPNQVSVEEELDRPTKF